MSESTKNPLESMTKSDPFEFAARVKLVFDNIDSFRKLDLSEIDKIERITRAAAGACGAVCGGC